MERPSPGRGGAGGGEGGAQAPRILHRMVLHCAAHGVGPLDAVGAFPFQQGPGQGAQTVQHGVQGLGRTEMIEAQDQFRPAGLQHFPYHQLVPLGGELPVDALHGVAGAVGAQVIVFAGAAAGPGPQALSAVLVPQ